MNNGEVGTRFSIKQVESYFCVGMSTVPCGIGISQKGKGKGECKNQRVELNFLSQSSWSSKCKCQSEGANGNYKLQGSKENLK